MERRRYPRHPGLTSVHVRLPEGTTRLCRARNLSANGAFIDTAGLGLKPGTEVEVAFAVREGNLTRLHRRMAVVTHVSRGGTGLRMQHQSSR
jgi:PilZ domain